MKNRIIVIALLLLLAGLGWNQSISSARQRQEEFDAVLQMARSKRDEGLYQISLEYYRAALNQKNDEAVWLEAIETTRQFFYTDIHYKTLEPALTLLDEGMSLSPETAEIWEAAVDLCLQSEEYQKANKYLALADSRGAASEELTRLQQQLRYTYTYSYLTFPKIEDFSGDRFAVLQEGLWGQMDSAGASITASSYVYIGPANTEGAALYVSLQGDATVKNAQGVAIAKAPDSVERAGVLSEDRIWVQTGGQASILNENGTMIASGFSAVGNYHNGLAAACQNGKWGLVDLDGSFVSPPDLDCINLAPNGTWVASGRMLAQKNGIYQIYTYLDQPVAEFSCDEMDVPTGDGIFAFARNGQWGFVNQDGEEVISPQFEGAKSFSNGVAAVCRDGLWGLIDVSGALVVEYQYSDIGYLTSRRTCPVQWEDGSWSLLSFVIS